MTNADYIRNMDDEELLSFLWWVKRSAAVAYTIRDEACYVDLVGEKWLKSENEGEFDYG